VLEDRADALRNLLAEARADPPNKGDERGPDDGNADRLAAFLAGDEPTVVYFGKLIPQKGVRLLLDAVRELDCRTVIVGFGPQRAELEAAAPPRTLFTGPLAHRHLVHLLPLADVTVVPSVFPEAFGMVAAEAAAAGSPPLVARHSGLAEVAAGIAAEYPEEHRALVSFERGDAADLERKLRALLELPHDERAALGRAAREAVVKRWSWASVADRLLHSLK
jgi:glycosyltransferase involved in cell wall biosynthesis